MKTSLGIWAFGGMATRFNPGGYKPELSGISTATKVRTAVEGLGDLMDDYEFHYPWELSPDNLDEVREVVADLAINPNTVAKAYRDLEREGLVVARQGRGTFVASTLAPASLRHHDELRAALERWLGSALAAGLDEESIRALISATLRESLARNVA